jgi:hypothetical protein
VWSSKLCSVDEAAGRERQRSRPGACLLGEWLDPLPEPIAGKHGRSNGLLLAGESAVNARVGRPSPRSFAIDGLAIHKMLPPRQQPPYVLHCMYSASDRGRRSSPACALAGGRCTGWLGRVVTVYRDEGISGAKGRQQRPGSMRCGSGFPEGVRYRGCVTWGRRHSRSIAPVRHWIRIEGSGRRSGR